ncbi:50S ribosomal protein L23 [candidate division BRC1 bacterium SM23_51]|nr:MAG: 50S ribosomal protein L23 [candidate division BRC1 bacterium SM23_51]
MKDPYEVLLKPVITEKATDLQVSEEPQYTFRVRLDANKIEIKKAIEAAFKVRVKRVNTVRVRGKRRRVRIQMGKRPDWKKAYVTLQKGEQIELY